MQAPTAGLDGRRQWQLAAEELEQLLAGRVGVVLDDAESALTENDAHVPALAPFPPEAGGVLGVGIRLGRLPLFPLRNLAVEPHQRPAELAVEARVLGKGAGPCRGHASKPSVNSSGTTTSLTGFSVLSIATR
jgi:hypothetical protein